nr:cation diffusion facilitator family transporter [Sinomonas mesophila]
MRALKISLFALLATTVLQFAVVLVSGSVALLADTVHNFSDALTAVPLWVAFILARRPVTKRYTYGYGRAEDLAGIFIVGVVALSAIVAGWQSVERLLSPHQPENLWWVVAAGLIGFAGNEAVAVYRINVGRRIGSAALVADGVHARTDGGTPLAVVLGSEVRVSLDSTVEEADRVRRAAQHRLSHALPNVEDITVAAGPF